jgi:hypothetical protein
MGKLKLAMMDLQSVVHLFPRDKTARKKLRLVKKAKRSADKKNDGTTVTGLLAEEIHVEASYAGPHLALSGITPDFVSELADWMRDQHLLHKRYVVMLI